MQKMRAALGGLLLFIWIIAAAGCAGQKTEQTVNSEESQYCWASVILEGGSGKASVESPCLVLKRAGELLAVILRSGTKNCSAMDVAYLLLDAHPLHKGITGLHHMDLPSLTAIKGIGKVKAVELLCVAELARRLACAPGVRARDFSAPELIAECYMEQMRHLEEEHVKLLIL